MTEPAAADSPGDIVARADFQYRWRVYALFALLFFGGLWCLRDGFVQWPRQNDLWARATGDKPPKPPHEQSGILVNQGLGVLLTALSVPVFAWMMYRSRGEYRFASGTLRIPGHPPVTLAQVRGLDLVQWDRKGVAVVEYQPAPDGPVSKLVLRDMVYHRDPTDQIVRIIEKHLEA